MSDCAGRIDDVLLHIVVCVGEDRVESWSCADVLCHYPGADVIRWCGALIPVCRDPMDSSVVEGEEHFWQCSFRDVFFDH